MNKVTNSGQALKFSASEQIPNNDNDDDDDDDDGNNNNNNNNNPNKKHNMKVSKT